MTDGVGAVALPSPEIAAPEHRKLKPKRGRCREEVSRDQLARLNQAMIELVDEGGYQAVTVRALVRRAGVSTRAFYEHFANLDACFVATYDLLIKRAGRTFAKRIDVDADISERVHSALGFFAKAVAAEPLTARFTVVAAPAAGPAVLEGMRHSVQRLGTSISNYLARSGEDVQLPPLLLHAMIAGALRVARARLLDGREDELPSLADPMSRWVLALRSSEAGELAELGRRRAAAGGARPGDADPDVRPVTGDERAMILAAIDRLSASHRYDELSVPRIRAAAGISRKSFDAQFGDVEECFLEALAGRAGRAFAAAVGEGIERGNWPAGVHCTIAGLCSRIARDPVGARAVFVEVFSPGDEGLRCRERLIGEVGERMRALAPAELRPSAIDAELSAAAVWALIHYHVAAGRTERLPAIAPTLSYLVLAPAIGAAAAVATIRAEEDLANRKTNRTSR